MNILEPLTASSKKYLYTDSDSRNRVFEPDIQRLHKNFRLVQNQQFSTLVYLGANFGIKSRIERDKH